MWNTRRPTRSHHLDALAFTTLLCAHFAATLIGVAAVVGL